MIKKPYIWTARPLASICSTLALAMSGLSGGALQAQSLTPDNLSWTTVDLASMGMTAGSIRSISGDSLANMTFAATENQIWQRSATEEKWTRMTSYDTWRANDSNFDTQSDQSLSAAGGYIFIGGAGANASRQRIAVWNGTSWSAVNTGWAADNQRSTSYVMTTADGTAQAGDVITVFGRSNARIFRLVNGVAVATPSQSSDTPDANTQAWWGIDALPSSNLIVAAGAGRADYANQSVIAFSGSSGQGGTWSYTESFPSSARTANVVSIVDENTWVAGMLSFGGTYGEVHLTVDAGVSWTQISPSSGAEWQQWVTAVWADSTDNIYAAVRTKGVLHYDGDTWSRVDNIASNDDIWSIHQLDDQLWFGGADSAGNPVLYTATAAIPEPGTTALMLGAAFALLLVRKTGKKSGLSGRRS